MHPAIAQFISARDTQNKKFPIKVLLALYTKKYFCFYNKLDDFFLLANWLGPVDSLPNPPESFEFSAGLNTLFQQQIVLKLNQDYRAVQYELIRQAMQENLQ